MASTKRYWPADLVLQLDICEGSCHFHGSKYPEGFVSDLPLNDSPPSQKGEIENSLAWKTLWTPAAPPETSAN